MRLDQYMALYFPEYSRSSWQKRIEAGYVLVNGEVVKSVKQTLNEDDEVSIQEEVIGSHEEKDVPILYEDENVTVFNKPIGMLTHAKGGIIAETTIADKARQTTTYARDTDRPGIVHRLDRATSGVIITVKNEETAKHLQEQFANRGVKKTYLAIVEGQPKHIEARLELPIERNPKQPSQFRVGPGGKIAVTSYKVLAHTGTTSLIELKPETGRTHQLRVHMAYIHCPILGDIVYGRHAARMFLHAWKLEITLPDGMRHTFEAPVPAAFTQYFPEDI